MLVTVVSIGGIERVEIPDENVIVFPSGVPGFDEARRFALFEANAPFYLLQCIDDPDLGFILIAPQLVWPSYHVDLPQSTLELLQLRKGETPQLLCIVSLPTSANEASVNLRAPLAFAPTTPLGVQVILPDSTYPVRHPLPLTSDGGLLISSEPTGEAKAGEPSGAASGRGGV